MSALSACIWGLSPRLLIVFLLSPIVLLVIFSFTSRRLTNFPIESLSLRWWEEMADHRQFWPAFCNSLIIGLCVGVDFGDRRHDGRDGARSHAAAARVAHHGVLTLPVMLPPLVLAVALLSFYVSVGLKLGLPPSSSAMCCSPSPSSS